jgi:hypothetical protein
MLPCLRWCATGNECIKSTLTIKTHSWAFKLVTERLEVSVLIIHSQPVNDVNMPSDLGHEF